MNLLYSCVFMFIGSVIVHYYIMSTIMIYNLKHFTNSIGKLYLSIIMGLLMVFIEILMHDLWHKMISIKYYIITSILLILSIYLYKKQVFINEKEYLSEMIEHHSMALSTSNEILQKTTDKNIINLAKNIFNTQTKEIEYMFSILQK